MIQRFYFDTSVLGGVFDTECKHLPNQGIQFCKSKTWLQDIRNSFTKRNSIMKTKKTKVVKKFMGLEKYDQSCSKKEDSNWYILLKKEFF